MSNRKGRSGIFRDATYVWPLSHTSLHGLDIDSIENMSSCHESILITQSCRLYFMRRKVEWNKRLGGCSWLLWKMFHARGAAMRTLRILLLRHQANIARMRSSKKGFAFFETRRTSPWQLPHISGSLQRSTPRRAENARAQNI